MLVVFSLVNRKAAAMLAATLEWRQQNDVGESSTTSTWQLSQCMQSPPPPKITCALQPRLSSTLIRCSIFRSSRVLCCHLQQKHQPHIYTDKLDAAEFADTPFMREGWVYVDGNDAHGRSVVVSEGALVSHTHTDRHRATQQGISKQQQQHDLHHLAAKGVPALTQQRLCITIP